MGTLKYRAVFAPLFPAFGPEPIRQRLTLGDGRVLVTTAPLYQKKIAEIRRDLSGLRHVLLVGGSVEIPGTWSFQALLDAASDRFEIPPTGPEEMALLHFTSGTTGKPKGGGARARRRGGPSRHRQLRARLPSGRRLLVYGRSRLGDRHVLWNHFAAHPRRHQRGRRGGFRRRALVRHPAGSEGHRLVHGAHRGAGADDGGSRDPEKI